MEPELIPGKELMFPLNPRVLVVAPSQSGKSSFLKKCLIHKESQFQKTYDRIIYSSPHFDPQRMLAKDREFMEEIKQAAAPVTMECIPHLITLAELSAYDGLSVLVVLDDHPQLFDSQEVSDIYVMMSSHKNFDIFSVCHQASANRGRYFNLIWSNCNVFVFFEDKTNKLNFGRYSSRLFPYCHNYLHRCLKMASLLYGPYAHLVINCDPASSSPFSVRSNIFQEHNKLMYVFKDP